MNTLKWISVLPLAILGNFIGVAIAKLFWWFSSSYMMLDFKWYNWIHEFIISQGIGGACFVIFGTYVAPKSKKNTSFVLVGAYIILSLGALYYNYESRQGFGSIVSIISAAVGSVIGLSYVDNDSDEIQSVI